MTILNITNGMDNTFPGFGYKAKELSAYLYGSNIFTIALKSKNIINVIVKDPPGFKAWLDGHRVRDISKSSGPSAPSTSSG